MSRKLRVGVAGGRWVGRMHAEGLSVRKDVELTAISDLDEDLREGMKADFGFRRTFGDYKEMIREVNLDTVVVALPTFMHYEASTLALRAGCHVLCEKPPMSSSTEMVKVARLAAERGLVYMFGRQSRFSPRVLAARKLVQRGTLGRAYHAEASWVRARWRGLAQPSWRLERDLGGGVLLDLGVHAIDEAWFCMGCPDPVEVSAGTHCAFRHFSPAPSSYTADDAAAGMIRFRDGATLSFMASFALNTPGPEGLAEHEDDSPEWSTTRIYGSKAGVDVKRALLIKGGPDRLEVSRIGVKESSSDFEAQAREFVLAVRAGRTPVSSAREAVMLMKILDAARRSGKTGRSVRIR